MVIQRSSDGRNKVGGIFIVLEKITEGREQVAVGGRGGSSRGKSNPPRALYTSPFTSQMFPQTGSVGCGPRRVESQHGFYWLSCAHCVMYACCVRKRRLSFNVLQWYLKVKSFFNKEMCMLVPFETAEYREISSNDVHPLLKKGFYHKKRQKKKTCVGEPGSVSTSRAEKNRSCY
ncbi:hypothetical protein AMECASPLE_008213 [Ameca splendens]|uniref:Uncharacterized protein n=1 Tax=Ameca splendens TaxID=208324 RepID=A0ABV0Z8Q6_9TELE